MSFATGQCSHGKLIYILITHCSVCPHSLRLTPNLKILQLHDLCRFVDFWKDCLIEQLEGLSGYGLPALVPPKLQNWACFGCFLMLGHCSFPSFFVLCFEGSLLFGIQCIPSASGLFVHQAGWVSIVLLCLICLRQFQYPTLIVTRPLPVIICSFSFASWGVVLNFFSVAYHRRGRPRRSRAAAVDRNSRGEYRAKIVRA